VTVIATAVISLLLASFLPVRFAMSPRPLRETAQARPGVDEWQPYSAAKVAELSASGAVAGEFYGELVLTVRQRAQMHLPMPPCKRYFETRKSPDKGDWTTAILRSPKRWRFRPRRRALYLVYNSKPGSTEPWCCRNFSRPARFKVRLRRTGKMIPRCD